MNKEPKSWEELEEPLHAACKTLAERNGSFADAPWEDGENLDETIGPMFPLEKEARAAVESWIDTGVIPPMSPGANRFAEVQFICARGLASRLGELPNAGIPRGFPLPSLLRWLLLDVFADTARTALDCMRTDLLGGRE